MYQQAAPFWEIICGENVNSVMEAIRNNDFDSYWTQTSATGSLTGYISMDFDGLSKTVAELIGGGEVKTDTMGMRQRK